MKRGEQVSGTQLHLWGEQDGSLNGWRWGQAGGWGLRGGAPPCWWCVHSILLLLLSPQKRQLICGHFVAFVCNLPQLSMWAVVWGVICPGSRASTPIGGPRPQPTSNVTVSLIEELNLTVTTWMLLEVALFLVKLWANCCPWGWSIWQTWMLDPQQLWEKKVLDVLSL